jgi:hypothetical protein
MGGLLFGIAYVLFLPLTLINYYFVKNKNGYFKSSAISLDRFGNREFRTLFNKVLILENGCQFGDIGETISSVLGKNERDNTLKKAGKMLVLVLDKIDKNHAAKSIDK